MNRSYKLITVSQEGAARTLTLNNPARKNAIGPVMINELLWALSDANEDSATRAVVLTGAGDAFCVGGDFSQMTSGGAESDLPNKGDFPALLLAIVNGPKPVIARVNGHAMGGGLGLVAASHFAVAVSGAKLGTPEVNVGLFPMMIMAVLQRVVPRRRLLQMMLLGERIDATEALSLGLVGHLVEPADLDNKVKELADAIAAKSPIAIQLGLAAFAEQDDMDLESALPLLQGHLGKCLSTDDAREGLMAFMQKRKPVWTGK